MQLDEATQILNNAGFLVEYTSMYSALSDFYRYLKVKAPKTGYDLEIEGDENSITVKFMGNEAKVTLEQFDEDEDPMLYVEAGGDERAFYNEHTDYGPAMQFIIKQICPTNEAFIKEDTDEWDDADLPASMTDTQRKKWAHRHNQTMSRDFEKFWKRSNHGKDYYDAKDDYKKHYGVAPVDDDKTLWGEEGRNLQQKVTRAKSFAGSPENNETIAKIFDLLKKSGWKYIGAKMGDNSGMATFATDKFFYFKKPGKGKKDYIVTWALYYPDEDEKPSKDIGISYHINGSDGSGTFKNAAAFVEKVNWNYDYYMGNKRPYNRHTKDNEPDYEEMSALDYEDR